MTSRNALTVVLLLAGLAMPARAQPEAVDPEQAEKLFAEIVDLMQTATVVVPELARAGAPLTENVRQAVLTLESGPSRDHVGVLYKLLNNAKVYLQLTDALPKPPSYSQDVRGQIESLRWKVDQVDAYFRSLLERRERQIRDSDRDNLSRYSEENGLLGLPGPDEQRVVFLGDSITDGWQLNQFFPQQTYINRGISGQTTGQMLGRMQADVVELRPAAMVFHGGTNDLARGVSLEAIYDNITMIATLAEANGIKPILATVLPVSDYHREVDPRFKRTTDRQPADISRINRWLAQFCRSRDYIYLDYYSALLDANGYLTAELADDGLHPNTEGYKVMTPLAQQAIEEALQDRDNRRKRRR